MARPLPSLAAGVPADIDARGLAVHGGRVNPSINQVLIQRNANGLWRVAGLSSKPAESKFTMNQESLHGALNWVARHLAVAEAGIRVNAPPLKVTGPVPLTVPVHAATVTRYRPLRSRVWPPAVVVQPPRVITVPRLEPEVSESGIPLAVQESEDAALAYMARIRGIISDYDAGGARRAALNTADLLALVSYQAGQLARLDEQDQQPVETEADARERQLR